MTAFPSSADVEQRAAGHEFRAVFMLRKVEEMSTAETAAVHDIPEETAKTRPHRARGLLQESLEQCAGEAVGSPFASGAARL